MKKRWLDLLVLIHFQPEIGRNHIKWLQGGAIIWAAKGGSQVGILTFKGILFGVFDLMSTTFVRRRLF